MPTSTKLPLWWPRVTLQEIKELFELAGVEDRRHYGSLLLRLYQSTQLPRVGNQGRPASGFRHTSILQHMD